MTRLAHSLVLGLALVVMTMMPPPPASAQRSPVIDFKSSDAEMNAAVALARRSLDRFWKALDNPGAGEDAFSLKVAVPLPKPNANEHIWMNAIERLPDGRLAGRLGNHPRDIPGKLGDRVEFKQEQISDWMFMRGGKMVGAETLRPMLKHLPKAEADRIREMLAPP